MRTHLVLAAMLGAAAMAAGCADASDGDEAVDEEAVSAELGLSVGGLCNSVQSCASIARGAHAFVDRKLHGLDGNGRACADCHMPTEHFQLTPAAVEARYNFLQARRQHNPKADDPLFRPIDADDFRTNGDAASDYSNLRENGLVRISMPLPSNIKLFNPGTGQVLPDTEVDVWRAVPSVLNVAETGPDGANPPAPQGPNPRGGYQWDARFGSLQEQALGAFVSHAQVQNAPSQRMLDDLANFQSKLFSPPARTNLNAQEQQGKAIFDRSCAVCHSGSAGSTPEGQPMIPRYHDIFSGCVRPVDGFPGGERWHFKACPPRLAKNIRFYQITLQDGSKIVRPSSDPARALLTGVVYNPPPQPLDDWQKFDIMPLDGISKTAPYFHNNSADTLEEVVDHYEAFFKFVSIAVPNGPLLKTPSGESRVLQPEEKAPLVAYLKTL